MIWRLAKDLDLPEFWPYGRLKGPKIENEARKNNVLSSVRPMDKNPRQHEQGSCVFLVKLVKDNMIIYRSGFNYVANLNPCL